VQPSEKHPPALDRAKDADDGEPPAGVSAPLVALILYAETVFEALLTTYTNLPDGSTATAVGPRPAAKGEPATRVSLPLLALIK
jgi:hypothetical protein